MLTMSTKTQRLKQKWKELTRNQKIISIVLFVIVLSGLIVGIVYLAIFLSMIASGF